MGLATACGLGYAPVAPGTAGAAGGVALFLVLAPLGPALFALTLVALSCLGIWAADAAGRRFGREDDGRIVIDEVAGQLLSLSPLLAFQRAGSVLLVVTGFVLFRVFDVWKPGPAAWAERRFRGGLGVMLDDLVAGLLAAAALAALVGLGFGAGAAGGTQGR